MVYQYRTLHAKKGKFMVLDIAPLNDAQ